MRETEPTITIELLDADGRRPVHAEAKEQKVVATLDLEPYADPMRPGGYILQPALGHARRAGAKLGPRQQERAEALVRLLIERVSDALLAARWQRRGKTPTDGTIWYAPGSASAEAAPVQVQRQVVTQTRAHGLARYQRTIEMRVVTFTCAQCGQTVTQQRYPGKPRYCSEACEQEATRRQTRARVQRWRARQKAAGTR